MPSDRTKKNRAGQSKRWWQKQTNRMSRERNELWRSEKEREREKQITHMRKKHECIEPSQLHVASLFTVANNKQVPCMH